MRLLRFPLFLSWCESLSAGGRRIVRPRDRMASALHGWGECFMNYGIVEGVGR